MQPQEKAIIYNLLRFQETTVKRKLSTQEKEKKKEFKLKIKRKNSQKHKHTVHIELADKSNRFEDLKYSKTIRYYLMYG